MARRTQIHTPVASRKVPRATGPYSPAVRVEGPGAMLVISAQRPLEMPSGQVFAGAFKRQAELSLSHLRNLIQDAGFTVGELAKVTVYLTDMAHLPALDEAYIRCLAGQALPARTVVGVAALPGGVGIAVDAVAIKAAAPAPVAAPEAPPEYDDY